MEWVELWDGRRWPGRVRDGVPEFGFGMAPPGLSTRRQLRDRGLCRGGQEPFARLVWKRDRRFAWLYVDAHAKPKRTATDAQLTAVGKALAARKLCAECGPVDHFVRTTDQLCGDCHEAGVTPPGDEAATWRVLHEWQSDTDASDDVAPAVDRAAEAAARAAAQTRHTEQATDDATRDEQLARWHPDDHAEHGSGDDDHTGADRFGAMEAGAA
ncbi:RRQRL motif-containing zinc-binding protein [Kribbella steppae]|uniref:RRQRL motif-containing zinc-binding protein n=1 Tax=Kribbella steppae TaxID=2512223 RepID=UPI0018EEB90B|nr:RRQRL motif-containing zinc-binding protein [Kribbella steppae]